MKQRFLESCSPAGAVIVYATREQLDHELPLMRRLADAGLGPVVRRVEPRGGGQTAVETAYAGVPVENFVLPMLRRADATTISALCAELVGVTTDTHDALAHIFPPRDGACFLHGDVTFGNILYRRRHLSVIDLELSGYGPRADDLRKLTYCALRTVGIDGADAVRAVDVAATLVEEAARQWSVTPQSLVGALRRYAAWRAPADPPLHSRMERLISSLERSISPSLQSACA